MDYESLNLEKKSKKKSLFILSLLGACCLVGTVCYCMAESPEDKHDRMLFNGELETMDSSVLLNRFDYFAKKYSKIYLNEEEKSHRFKIFLENYQKINKAIKEDGLLLSVNHFADLTQEEFEKHYMGMPWEPNMKFPKEAYETTGLKSQSDEADWDIDWNREGVVSRVKDQNPCGGCWAFSACGAMESLHFMVTGEMIEFSEQELIDCDDLDDGCVYGGFPHTAFKWVSENGIMLDEDYPFIHKNTGYCKRESPVAWRSVAGYRMIEEGEDSKLYWNSSQRGCLPILQKRNYHHLWMLT
eukprot:TRINITY_DN608_c0_g2_i2.p1 TRINITY_DN608_c0_g2~~TRINITY_DN608_c0_g2_i2.p1  ORF type:complete len:299 (+),score=67.98 TRINITY_DN608_c0_g2_i2:3-899(+)